MHGLKFALLFLEVFVKIAGKFKSLQTGVTLFLFVSAYNIIFSIAIVTYVKHGHIVDHVKNSYNVLQVRKVQDGIVRHLCNEHYPDRSLDQCKIVARSFATHYNTFFKKFKSGAWCMGHRDMLLDYKSYFDRKQILTGKTCKNFLKDYAGDHDFLISKHTLSTHCPHLVNSCLFTHQAQELEEALLMCNINTKYQGISCTAIIDGKVVRHYAKNKEMPLTDLLRSELGRFSFFGDLSNGDI